MKILHVSSEVAPWSKTGGLGDVASALPRALAAIGGDEVAVVTPAYRVDSARFGLHRRSERFEVWLGGHRHEVGVAEGVVPGGGGPVRAWLIEHEAFHRDGVYGDHHGEFGDNAFRFALLSRAALVVPRALGFVPDVLHAHDWPTGPALRYAKYQWDAPRTVFTIHNLAFQGLFAGSLAGELDLAGEAMSPDGHEFYGNVSYLKAGLAAADRITTVSPTYAREILTGEYGFGLDGYLRAHADRLGGILNGVDYGEWNPASDPICAAPFSRSAPSGKRACKAALQRTLGLPERPRVPLVAAVSRLSWQKGFDLLAEALERVLPGRESQWVILGSGEREIEERLLALSARHPGQVAVRIEYDESLAHRIYAGADLFAMPSRYEPCGLGQLYALRYGAVPIVRATGGLEDTVIDRDAPNGNGTGFKFDHADPGSLEHALHRALTAYEDEERFAQLVSRGMAADFSWQRSAIEYRALYQSLLR